MERFFRSVGDWIREHPHSLVCLASGFVVGIFLRYPTGWVLPDPIAAMAAAFAGAAAAVGGALWAANAKQQEEDARAEERRQHVAKMIATIIYPEIASAQRNMKMIATRLEEQIPTADAGNQNSIIGMLRASALDHPMCLKFVDRLDVFGDKGPLVIEAIAAIADMGTLPTIAELIPNVEWKEARVVVVMRIQAMRFYAERLGDVLRAIAPYHPRPNEVIQVAAEQRWPSG
jgi:hypothetical protein